MPNPAKLTRKQRNQIQAYVNGALAVFNMSDWEVHVMHEFATEIEGLDVFAEIDASEEYRTAKLRVGRIFLSKPAKVQRATIAHELTHLPTARLSACVENIKDELAPAQRELFWKTFTAAEEFAVEALSRLLVGLLPLPRFG